MPLTGTLICERTVLPNTGDTVVPELRSDGTSRAAACLLVEPR